MRFDVGQRSNFALIPALSASLNLLLEWRPERVAAYTAALMRGALPRLRDLGVWVEDETWRSPHLFGLGLPPGTELDRLKASLERHRVGVSFRGTSVRVSPNVYNTQEDAEALVRAFEATLAK